MYLFLVAIGALCVCFCSLSFVWPHAFAPVLPRRLLPHLASNSSATPFFVGVHSALDEDFAALALTNIVVVDLDAGTLEYEGAHSIEVRWTV